jgi:tRNA-specific 2-thiouridylase
MSRGRVAVGMSGGVDSSAAAALLLEQGYDVVGATMRHLPPEAANSCCSLEAVVDARRVAKKLGIEHHLVDVEETFADRVIRPFEEAYLAGQTPNPCAACNRYVKFGALWDWAKQAGADFIATGHFARIVDRGDHRELWRAADTAKDQSYILYTLGQDDLRHVLFPLGEWTKAMVRAYAAEKNLATARKAESQELCFVAQNDYRRYLEEHRPEVRAAGDVVDTSGRRLGRHEGIAFYTVGQRRGLGVQAPTPLYVVAVDAAENRVVVGTREEATTERAQVVAVHYPDGRAPGPVTGTVRVRSHAQEAAADWIPDGTDRATVRFHHPEWAVTPGQVAVLYDGDHLVAGGRIDRVGA